MVGSMRLQGVAKTIASRIRHWGINKAESPAFIFVSPSGNRSVLSHTDVFQLSGKFANRLKRIGVCPGDVVCNTLQNSPDRVISEFGIHLAGGIAVTGKSLFADGRDLKHTLKKSNCSTIIIDPDQSKGVWDLFQSSTRSTSDILENEVDHSELPSLKNLIFSKRKKKDNDTSFLETINAEKTEFMANLQPSDPSLFFETSGTTGLPKLALHTQSSILNNATSFTKVTGCEMERRYFCSSDLGWSGSYPYLYLALGATGVIPDLRQGLPSHIGAFFWEIICQERCRVAIMTPTHAFKMMEEKEKVENKIWILDNICFTGQPVRKNFMQIIGKVTNKISNYYGSSEAGEMACKTVGLDKTFEDYCCGSLLPGVEAKVIDSDKNEVSENGRGEILIKSKSMFSGYYGDQEATIKTFTQDDWFITGDTGYIHKDGQLYVEGRGSDAIMRGNKIIYPPLLEKKGSEIPGVADIAVISVPDEILFHEICACVVFEKNTSFSAEDLKEKFKELFRGTADSAPVAAPKYVIIFDVLPRTLHGKVDRKKLKAKVLTKLNME